MIESVTPVFLRRNFRVLTPNFACFYDYASVLPAQAQEYARKISWSYCAQNHHVLATKKYTQPTFKGAAHLQKYGMSLLCRGISRTARK